MKTCIASRDDVYVMAVGFKAGEPSDAYAGACRVSLYQSQSSYDVVIVWFVLYMIGASVLYTPPRGHVLSWCDVTVSYGPIPIDLVERQCCRPPSGAGVPGGQPVK